MTQVKVSDADSATDSTGFGLLNYAFESTGPFKIDPNSGVVKIGESLDYETQPIWTMIVVAVDGGGKETRCSLQIEVTDANEAAPIFQTPTEDDLELFINSREVKETYLMSVEAIDPDFNPETNQGGIEYEMTGGDDILKINSNSGEITLLQNAAEIPEEKITFRIILTVSNNRLD